MCFKAVIWRLLAYLFQGHSLALTGSFDSEFARQRPRGVGSSQNFFFFFCTLVTGPRRSLSLKLSDTRVYEPQIRARLGTTPTIQGSLAGVGLCHGGFEIRRPLVQIGAGRGFG